MIIRLIDMYCGAGGCSMGYYMAALDLKLEIEIIGVDRKPQPNYPFKFVQADALEYFMENMSQFTHVHASPPCQKFTPATHYLRARGQHYDDYLEETRALIELSKLPGVIENVPASPVRPDIMLRGDMFGLKVLRKRHFETINWFMMNPGMPRKQGSAWEGDYVTVYGKGGYKRSGRRPKKLPKFQKNTVVETWKYAMGIWWMKKDTELSQAIPPAYTRYIGNQFFR